MDGEFLYHSLYEGYSHLQLIILQKTIAFFDFDGTITRKDTMLEFIKFSKGNGNYIIGMMILSPSLLLMKFGLLSKKVAKEKMLGYFFAGTQINEFNKTCQQFIEQKVPSLIRTDAMNKIREHLSNGNEVVVVSASAENWMSGWCLANGLKVIATKLEVINNKITGKLNGENCNGIEKVNRIKQAYDPANYDAIYCYGDTEGDQPMLQIATHPFYRLFKS